MDALADVLDVSGISGTVLAHVRAHEPWGLDLAPAGAAFHTVIAGSCWLQLADAAPLRLMPGDVVLLPTGSVTGCSARRGRRHAPTTSRPRRNSLRQTAIS